MRVIAGTARGRRLRSRPGREVRPTPDRVREALFSILAGRVPGSAFLDLFAGYGGVGIEALSRGARRAVFVEADAHTCRVLQLNLAETGFDGLGRCLCMRVETALGWLRRRGERFDLIFADPPYALASPARVAEAVAQSGLLLEGGVFIFQHDQATEPPPRAGPLRRADQRRYGRTGLAFYQWEEEVGEDRSLPR